MRHRSDYLSERFDHLTRQDERLVSASLDQDLEPFAICRAGGQKVTDSA
ncbi:hypothetical protein [Marinactinospora rubrisoli]|uniref:Uncharacterized protein n=1 Tax=Marinactinospora rubrisoli TaxID=2715399 RepID=A0ABW2KF84_9ACTN